MSTSAYDRDLDKRPANFVPLTPISFLKRSALIYPDKVAVIDGERRFSYAEFEARCRRLASWLASRGVGRGDTVSVLAPNVPALLEAHYACPMLGAVLNAINTRLDARTVAFILDHGEAKAFISDGSLSGVAKEALRLAKVRPVVVDVEAGEGERLGEIEYEEALAAVTAHV